MEVSEILAKQAISELHLDYARGVDHRNWELFGSIFDDTVISDYSRWGMGTRTELPREELVALVQHMFSTDGLVTQHYMTNARIEIDGECASGEVYVFARHKLGDEAMDLNAYYTSTYAKRADGWKITSIKMTPRWDEGSDVVKFFQLPNPDPTDTTYLLVSATPILANHDALERYVNGIVPMLMKAGGSKPLLIKKDAAIIGAKETFMSMLVTFDNAKSSAAARAVFKSEAYATLIPDRDKAFSSMNIAFYSDMPSFGAR